MSDLRYYELKAFLTHNCYLALLILFFLWMCIGIFPLTCYESDSMHVIAGCDIMFNQGITFPPVYSYLYDMQPLVTYLVIGCKYIMPFLTCEQIYCILSALCSFMFIVGSITFANRITSLRKELILLVVFLIPESFAISMYPNSAVFAAAFFIWALNKLLDNKALIAVVLMVIAPLFRMDILITYPVIFFIFLFQKSTIAKSLLKSAYIALAVVVSLFLCCWGLNANPLNALTGYGKYNDNLEYAPLVKYAVFTFYTVINFILIPIGLYFMFRSEKYKSLLIALVPILLVHFMFRNTGCATKHFLYLIPFVTIICSYAINSINLYIRNKKFYKWITISTVVFFLCFSIRFYLPDPPGKDMSKTEGKLGPWISLYQENFSKYHASFGIGAGQLIVTLDEYMLLSGNLFYPFYIHNYKKTKENKRLEIKKRLADVGSYNLLAFSWEDMFYFPNLLLSEGFRFDKINSPDFSYTLSKENYKITLYVKEIYSKDKEAMKAFIDGVSRKNERDTYIVTALEGQEYLLDEFSAEGIVTKQIEKLYVINKTNTR